MHTPQTCAALRCHDGELPPSHTCLCAPAAETDEDRHGPWSKENERYEDGCREDRPHSPATETDVLRDLLGHADDDALIEVIASAISDAQTHGRVEYKRRVGLAGRRAIAETVLWRLREHLNSSSGRQGGGGDR